MIKTQVKKSWNGMVAVRSKYVQEAMRLDCPLVIECENKIMKLSAEELESKLRFKRDVEDYFHDGAIQELYYYSWRPNLNQQTLI